MKKPDEVGQVLVLALGLALVVFAVAGLAVDGTGAFLMQRSLQNVADSAAVSAASSIDRRAYYTSGGAVMELDETLAMATAERMVEQRSIPVDVSFVAAPDHVEIVVRSASRTTFLRLVGIEHIEVRASALAAAFPQVIPTAP